jgi:hypothetical protein
MKEDLTQQQRQFENDKDYYIEEIKVREHNILNLEKFVENYKKQNSEYKNKLMELTEEYEKVKHDYIFLTDQSKSQSKFLKKEIREKEASTAEMR